MKTLRSSLRPAFTAALAAALPALLHAGFFTVDPIQIHLSPKQTRAIVTVRNDSAEPMRFQVTPFGWDQSETGEERLTPTTDILPTPRLVTVAPGQTRQVRVAMGVPVGTTEKTYRLIVEELPPAGGPVPGGPPGVVVRTRMSLPIFAAPAEGRSGAVFTSVTVERGRVVVHLANQGTMHIAPESVRVTGRAPDGGLVFDRTASSWYVLAGRARTIEIPLSADECSRTTSVTTDMRIGDLTPLSRTSAVTSLACGPPGAR